MKKTILFIAVLLLTITVFGQQGINYKAVISDNGNVLQNQSVSVRFTILESGITLVYEENHTATTDSNGIIIVNIGEGTATNGDFTTINWSQEQFLKVEIDTGGGYANFGTTAFKSVPYAKYADNGGGAKEINGLTDAKSDGLSVYLGTYSGINDDGGNFNSAIGVAALLSNTSGQQNTVFGYNAGYNNHTGNANTFIGNLAGHENISGSSNVFLGIGAGYFNQTAHNNIFLGTSSGFNNQTGFHNVFIGNYAGHENISGDSNVFLGFAAGYYETGSQKLYIENSNSSTPLIYGDFATDEVVINGSLAIKDGTEGLGKIFTSDATGKGSWQTSVIKINDLTDAKSDGYSVYLGANSGINDDGSNWNSALGAGALKSNTSGWSNIAIGYNAGASNLTGNGNVFLGYTAGYFETGSNKLYIENSGSNTPLIGGDFATDKVTINGTLTTLKSTGTNILTVQSLDSAANLYIKSTGTNNPSTHYYLDNTFKASTGFNVAESAYYIYQGGNVFFKNGNILPATHITKDLGGNGIAWNNVYAHNYITQGSAAYTDRSVTKELIKYPPIAKKEGDFDAKSDGLYELNPQSLPVNLHTDNGLKIDEISTYNYKANYEQQLQINELKTLLITQQKRIEKLMIEITSLKQNK